MKKRNKSMKKMITLLCAVFMLGALLTACGQSAETPQEPQPVDTEQEVMEGVEEPEEAVETEENAEAAEVPEAEAPAAVGPSVDGGEEMGTTIRVYGQVKEMSENTVFIANDNPNDMYGQIILNVTEDTLIPDAVSADVKTVEDIGTDEVLYAYVSPAMTRSLPPMSNAELIFCDIPSDIGVPEYAEVVSITTGEDGKVSPETNRDIIYHLGEETEIADFATGESIDASAIEEGSKVIAWYQIVLQSLPAQTTPTKIVVF